MSTDKPTHDCDFKDLGTRKSTGENMLGKEVTAVVRDLECIECGVKHLIVLQADKQYAKENI